MDGRSLEDKILKKSVLTEKDSDEEFAPERDTDDDTDEELDPFAEELARGNGMGPGSSGRGDTFGAGADGLAPSSRFAGHSGKTGPKGVLDDYRMAQKDLARRRDQVRLERLEMVRRAGGATMDGPSMSLASEAGKAAKLLAARAADESDDDSDADGGDTGDGLGAGGDEDDEFMKRYREKRLAQLKALAKGTRFGTVTEVKKLQMVTEVDKEAKDVWVVVHLYENFDRGCRAINRALPEVARSHPNIKFLRMVASEASDTFDHIALPTLIFYRGGATVHAVVRACDRVGPEPAPADIEWLMSLLGVIEGDVAKPPSKLVEEPAAGSASYEDEDSGYDSEA